MGKNINGDRPTAFPLEQEKLPFTIPVVEEPRPKIAKLVAMITDRVPAKLKGVKGNDPEYWGLADLVTDEMADVALKMGVRKPKTIQQLMKLTKLEREPLQKLLDQMAWVGLIEYNWENLDGKNPNHEKRYVLPQFVPGSAEFFNMRRSQMDELAIIELDAELLGEDTGQLTSARTILTADRDDEILFHSRFPLSKCKRFLFR